MRRGLLAIRTKTAIGFRGLLYAKRPALHAFTRMQSVPLRGQQAAETLEPAFAPPACSRNREQAGGAKAGY